MLVISMATSWLSTRLPQNKHEARLTLVSRASILLPFNSPLNQAASLVLREHLITYLVDRVLGDVDDKVSIFSG